jgi:hypothetical protein
MLRATGAAETAIWALVRLAIAMGGAARRIGEAVIDQVRPAPREKAQDAQLDLWVGDGEKVSVLPWRLDPFYRFPCQTLRCETRAGECVRRQLDTEGQGTRDTWRGQAAEFPSCNTKCLQGAAVRAALDPASRVALEAAAEKARGPARGASGFGLRRRRSKKDRDRQVEAKERQAQVGLLDDAPTIDSELETVPE